jgi:hypothetical protein
MVEKLGESAPAEAVIVDKNESDGVGHDGVSALQGMLSFTLVPCPHELSTSSVPPILMARSRMMVRP